MLILGLNKKIIITGQIDVNLCVLCIIGMINFITIKLSKTSSNACVRQQSACQWMRDVQSDQCSSLHSLTMSNSWMNPLPGPDVAAPQQKRQRWSKAARADNSTSDSAVPDFNWMHPNAGEALDTQLASGQKAWMRPLAGDPNAMDFQLGDDQATAVGTGQQAPSRRIHLDMATVMMASEVGGSKCEPDIAKASALPASAPSAYARNGMHISRISKVIDAGCKCRTQCRSKFKDNKVAVHNFCKAWYSLSPDAQGHLLQVCYDSAGGSPPLPGTATFAASGLHKRLHAVRTDWYFLGNHVTTDCLVAMIGTSARTLFKNCKGFADGSRLFRTQLAVID